jgi:hypothetical protein
MSSMSSARSPAARSIAARMATAAMSSGRVEERAPRGALPTGVRTAETITAFMLLFSQFRNVEILESAISNADCEIFRCTHFSNPHLKSQIPRFLHF